MRRLLPLVAGSLAALAAAASPEPDGGDATCTAGKACAEGGSLPHYYWPSARGRHENPSRSPYKGPRSLSASLAWTWNHPEGQYRVIIPAGPLIDDRKNIYLSTTEQIFSLDSEGKTRWVNSDIGGRLSDNPSIWNGTLYTISNNEGFLHALDMETGKQRWKVQLAADGTGGDIASVTAHEGRVYASAGRTFYGGCAKVVCSDASDGTKLWEVAPDTGLWNFIPMFPGDGNVVFQTDNGDPYVVRISDGEVQWKKHREPVGWTDGGTIIGPNGVAYVVHADGHMIHGALTPTQTSDITAYRISDGKQLWRHGYQTPPNSWPVVAPMGKEKRWTVLFPYGGQAYQSMITEAWTKVFVSWAPSSWFRPFWAWYLSMGTWAKYVFKYLFFVRAHWPWPGGVTAFEPETGKVMWEWKAPDWWMPEVKGDDAGLAVRAFWAVMGKNYGQNVCIPNPWASPTVDADGTMYLGFQNGILYAVREEEGKGEVVDSYETSAGFSHPGVAMAPGMLAITNCDTLYVFKYAES